jgi:sortase A
MIEKRRKVRLEKLEHFRRTGRVVTLATDTSAQTFEHLRSDLVDQGNDELSVGSPKRRNRILDGMLLGIEILAVLGLIYVLLNGWQILRDLNDEVAQALELPTMTPTPLIVAIVLPSGHTPPDSPGGARPNEAEIPEHLRPLVQSLANLPVPTPGPGQATRIQIPSINVDAPIVQGDGWEQLKKGVGQHIGSGNPGENGNLVLSAHNDVFGEIFRELDQLKPGDLVIIYTNQRSYTYVINDSEVVEPTQVEVMAPTDLPTLTLISCYPYLIDNQRIVVKAMLEEQAK